MSSVGGVSCDSELTPRTALTSLRILAIKAEPPEIGPGESTIITALVVDPKGYGRTLDWLLALCTPDEASGGCLEYETLSQIYPNEDVAQYEYAECCARKGEIEPKAITIEMRGGLQSSVQVLDSMLEGVDAETAAEGVNAQVNLLFCQSGACTTGSDPNDAASTDTMTLSLPEGLATLAIKRLRVSSKAPDDRNQNPELDGILFDDELYNISNKLEVKKGTTYRLVPSVHFGSIEEYKVVNEDGTESVVEESPYFTWFATEGDFSDFSSDLTIDKGAVEWNVPAEPEKSEITVALVMRDRRGGFAWSYFVAEVE